MIRDIFKIIPKTINPRYYNELSDEKPLEAFKYLLVLIVIAFLCAAVIASPKIYMMKRAVDRGMLEISEMKVTSNFKTASPILIPATNPAITFDTTGNKTRSTELALITDKKISYNLFNKDEEFTFDRYDINKSRDETGRFVGIILLVLIPGLLLFYYLIYLAKYMAIIALNILISYGIAKLFKNRIEFKQAISLAIYTATPMILIEILSVPFFVNKYLLAVSPIVGFTFSLVAITVYLTLYVTSIRLTGSKAIKE